MSEVRFGSWSVAESPVTVEYSLAALEDIRQEVVQGFQKFARGGVEVGGILYGERDVHAISVLAMRPIQCEHARGPDFLLSGSDRAVLERQIRQQFEDSRLEGMCCVGWFLSHTRSDVMLSDSDLEIYSAFFGAPWQVTLVIRPGRGGSMRAGFFVREQDGSVRSQRSYLEFTIPGQATASDSPLSPEPGLVEPEGPVYAPSERGTATLPVRRETIGTLESKELETWDGPRFLPARRASGGRWLWLAGWLAVVTALAIVSLQYFGILTPRAVPISLAVEERDGQLQIEWNRDANPVAAAAQGSLDITDGGDVHTVALTPQDLARGSFFYYRNSGDVQVRLVVTASSGKKLAEEASRFMGRPPMNVDPNELQDLQSQRDEAQAEVEQLKQENDALAERVQELERTLRIMQARMGR